MCGCFTSHPPCWQCAFAYSKTVTQISARQTGLNYCGVCVLKIAVCSFDILISVKTQISREENISSVIPAMLQVGSFTDGTLQEGTPYRSLRILEWKNSNVKKLLYCM